MDRKRSIAIPLCATPAVPHRQSWLLPTSHLRYAILLARNVDCSNDPTAFVALRSSVLALAFGSTVLDAADDLVRPASLPVNLSSARAYQFGRKSTRQRGRSRSTNSGVGVGSWDALSPSDTLCIAIDTELERHVFAQ